MATPTASLTPDQVQAKVQALLNGPAVTPPAGVTPNLVDSPKLEATIVPILALGLTITTLAVLVRLYSKLFLLRSIAYEDCDFHYSPIGHVGLLVTAIFVYANGGGVHTWNMRLNDFFEILYWLKISGILYGIITCLIKESILLQYMTIFVPNRTGNMILYVTIQLTMWEVALFYLVDTNILIGMCNSREKIWNLLMTTGHCFNGTAADEATGVFNVISDFAILIVPIFPTWKLQIPLKRKIMIIAIFATGVCACITSVIRTYYSFKMADSFDISYDLIIMCLWSWGEITSGILIVCLPIILIVCLPIMPKFFRHVVSKIHGTWLSMSKSRFKVENNSSFSVVKKRQGSSDKLKRPFDKYMGGLRISKTCSDWGTRKASYKDSYVTSNEIEVVTPENIVNGQSRAIFREDLESGRHNL